MIWFKTAMFFLLYMIYMILILNFYAKALIKVSILGHFFKVVFSSLLYLLFAIAFIFPFFHIHEFVDDFHIYFDQNNIYFVFTLISFALVCSFSIIYFNKKFVPKLKALGYFK
ncbi:hypothetical protein [Acinetobacter amyesii]|uniref:hypothetical protein n=1 Tax=Acinetobacter amyesii TaxID=2942470 RepID=UPI0020BF4024|nr:hypothetical protein [Acinetobacter amyesii]MCL6242515.1 hypothetical protein [Acinetobacter amyesii]